MIVKCGETKVEWSLADNLDRAKWLMDIVKEMELKRIRTVRDAKIKINTKN